MEILNKKDVIGLKAKKPRKSFSRGRLHYEVNSAVNTAYIKFFSDVIFHEMYMHEASMSVGLID